MHVLIRVLETFQDEETDRGQVDKGIKPCKKITTDVNPSTTNTSDKSLDDKSITSTTSTPTVTPKSTKKTKQNAKQKHEKASSELGVRAVMLVHVTRF